MFFTTSTGYLPTDVSPESITASAPSKIEFATSETSARVGTGDLIIDSTSMEAKLRYIIALGFISVSDNDVTGNSLNTVCDDHAVMAA